MPRRSILTAAEYDSLVAIPDARDELIRLYTFSDADLVLVSQRRGPANRLGFAVQLCYLRFPGAVLGADAAPFVPLLRVVAAQIKVPPDARGRYSERRRAASTCSNCRPTWACKASPQRGTIASPFTAWTSCSSIVTAARQHGWPGCASRRSNQTRGTCASTSNG